ncbi:DUF1963 domain-containing protein [Novosphingobium flavum]|uniref:DUF1963 domain-containing protein n=1 Tax=Novosphingobium aerophilum TaxID=2839843 RepID=UPI00163B5AF5|nr:DUF1963 domain-containing protein [Novosphingobium aerophilum]MBC2661345.1 DUF1963 domain-containing protein [Novosphingobium aerophilum]
MDHHIESLFTQLRRDAVLLHRPYPPFLAKGGSSKLGGLPNLPADVAWPRMKNGTPLHFLAQINCRHLPFRCSLPDHGLLFFFGLDNDEQVWDEDVLGEKGYRVIFAADADGSDPKRSTPHDLAPIGGIYTRPGHEPFFDNTEARPNVHCEWPIELRRMDSWPDASALTDRDLGLPFRDPMLRLLLLMAEDTEEQRLSDQEDNMRRAYDVALAPRRAAAFREAAAYGLPEAPDWRQQSMEERQQVARIMDSQGSSAWPTHWATIGYFGRALRKQWQFGTRDCRTTADDRFVAIAGEWIQRADQAGAAAKVNSTCLADFRAWALAGPGTKSALARSYSSMFTDCMLNATLATVRCFAHDRDLASQIPPVVYQELAYRFQGNSVWGVKFSQMLGYAPSSQQAMMTDDPDICLLSLASEDALGWMFGDVGEATFWIAPDALARRNFDAVQAVVEGG